MSLPTVVDSVSDLNGNKTILKDLLKQRLVECGWEDKVRLLCQEQIKNKEGKITADEMYDSVVQEARSLVPSIVKRELLQKIKNSLLQNEELSQ